MSRPPSIPDYELHQSLGGGPLTHVFSALDLRTDEPVAVKILRDEWGDDPTAVKLLQREARAGLSVRHPHLVQLVDAHVLAPPYFLVMELLSGESLRDRLRRNYALDVSTAVWVARQIAEALAAMHRAGFVHGDVKPDNIRLTDEGTAVLIDLGFAHRPGENAPLSDKGYVLGTASYLAPEMCGTDPADETSGDLFALGVTLFEMLTGELPYPAGSVPETLALHRETEPARLSDFDGRWPSQLVTLVDGLLSRKPSSRPRPHAIIRDLIGLEIVALRKRRSA